jgi:hypothetical protein
MAMDMFMRMAVPGQPMELTLPTIEMEMGIEITERLSADEARYRFAMTDARALTRPGVMPGVVDGTQVGLDSAKGMTGTAIMDTRGFNRDATMELPPGLDPQMRQMMEGSMQNLEQMSAPLPAEAVGKGARWELTQRLEQNGMKLDQITAYELVALDGDRLTLSATVTQKADRQTVTTPAGSAELLELSSTGSGTVDIDLAHLVPTSKVNLVSDYSMQAMGQTIDAHLTMAIEISRK